MSPPTLSVVVAFDDMRREAPRTLQTLAPAYQRGVGADDYEEIAVDVGSEPPLDEALVRAQGQRFRLLRFRGPSPPPPPSTPRCGSRRGRP